MTRRTQRVRVVVFRAPVAARGVSGALVAEISRRRSRSDRLRRKTSLAPRERSACAGSGGRSRPHPAEPPAGAPNGRRSRVKRGATCYRCRATTPPYMTILSPVMRGFVRSPIDREISEPLMVPEAPPPTQPTIPTAPVSRLPSTVPLK